MKTRNFLNFRAMLCWMSNLSVIIFSHFTACLTFFFLGHHIGMLHKTFFPESCHWHAKFVTWILVRHKNLNITSIDTSHINWHITHQFNHTLYINLILAWIITYNVANSRSHLRTKNLITKKNYIENKYNFSSWSTIYLYRMLDQFFSNFSL